MLLLFVHELAILHATQGNAHHKLEINKLYEPGPPPESSMEGEGYESISYDANGIKRRSMKVRTDIIIIYLTLTLQ